MSSTVTDLPSGKDVPVFGAGDYVVKNSHLYFILDYTVGGYILENCETLYEHPVDYEFMRQEVTWVARDTAYAKQNRPSKRSPTKQSA